MGVEESRLKQRHRDDDREAEPINGASRIDIAAEERKRRNVGNAHRASRKAVPVEDDEAHDLADRERGDGDIMPAQAEGREDEQGPERAGDQSGSGDRNYRRRA
jgi:hypothetical protein